MCGISTFICTTFWKRERALNPAASTSLLCTVRSIVSGEWRNFKNGHDGLMGDGLGGESGVIGWTMEKVF